MARSMRFAKVEGMEGLQAAVDRLKKRVTGDDVRKVLMKGAFVFRDELKERAPVDTGVLKDSIIATYGKTDQIDINVLVGVNHKKAPHAHFSELGTSKEPARPWYRPGISAKRDEVGEVITDGVKKLIEDTE